MITRKVRLHELLRRSYPDGSIGHTALIAFDEGSATTVRLTADEHAVLEKAMRGKSLVMTLRVGAPTIQDLAAGDLGVSA